MGSALPPAWWAGAAFPSFGAQGAQGRLQWETVTCVQVRRAGCVPAPSSVWAAGFLLTVLSPRGPDVWLDTHSSLEHELRFLCERALFKVLPWMLKFQKTRKEKASNCPQMFSRRGLGLSRCWRTPPTCPQADSERPGGCADLAGGGGGLGAGASPWEVSGVASDNCLPVLDRLIKTWDLLVMKLLDGRSHSGC